MDDATKERQILWDVLRHTSLPGVDASASAPPAAGESPGWFPTLYEQMRDAHSQWSSLAQDWFDWCAHVVSCLQRSAPYQSIDDWLARCHMSELYLAFGCLWGSEQALQQIREQSDPMLQQIIRRFARPPLMPEELQQELWIGLFVNTESREAKLASYAGQGPLNAWLRVTAVRACIDYTRTHPHLKREKPIEDGDLLSLPEQTFDVELDFLKHEYREHFREAFAAGVAALPSRDRLLLRYHVIEGLSIDQIGALFQFHRSTAARHLQQARQRLLEETEQALTRRLRISQTEFQSVIRLIQSQWEVSVQRLLAQQPFSSLSHELPPG